MRGAGMRRGLRWLALTAALAPPAMAGDGTTFRGDAAHSGFYAGTEIGSPALRWKFRSGGQVIGSPAIANGTVYIGATDGKMYALEERTGTQRWAFQTHARIASTA